MHNNIVKLSKTKIIVICYSVLYEHYINIVERYREIFSSHTFRRDNMYFEFDYNNKIDYNDDKYIIMVVEAVPIYSISSGIGIVIVPLVSNQMRSV